MSLAAVVSFLKKKKIQTDFLLGSHKADGHHGFGNTKSWGTVVTKEWLCPYTSQLSSGSRVYSVGGQYFYLVVNYGPQNAKWVWLQPQSSAQLLWWQVGVSRADPCYKRVLCTFSPALPSLCTFQLLLVHASAPLLPAKLMLFSWAIPSKHHQPRYQPTNPPAICSPPSLTSPARGCMSHGKNHQGDVLATSTAAPCCNWRRMWLLVMGILMSCPSCSLQWQATDSSIHHLYLFDDWTRWS